RAAEAGKQAAAIAHYVRQYRIVMVVVKLPPLTHLTEKLKEILKTFVSLFEYHGCMVQYKDDGAIKRHIPSARNKEGLIGFVCETYTVLSPVRAREINSRQKRYHSKMFEAVAVAHICSQNSP
ncbi:MAG: hypothetical protein ABIN95_14130, partial [Mucilaginibacter sp.]